jgi:protocatechuate 3,4-dioxygenase beta subunit
MPEDSQAEPFGVSAMHQQAGPPAAATAPAGQGPYYVVNTRALPDGNLNYAGLPGQPIEVSGHVYGVVGAAVPLRGARLELWHADHRGSYHPNASGDALRMEPDRLALRGYVVSDAEGFYQFRSIYPGKYPGRCRHIHVRATAEGHTGIFTQLIFLEKPGDDLTPERDPVARYLPDENHLKLRETEGVLEAHFDFRLAPG